MSKRATDKQRKANAERAKRFGPREGEDGLPVNFTPPQPPPMRDAIADMVKAGRGPTITIPGAHPPPHVLTGADMMGDDRVCHVDMATGRVKLFRRLESWNVHKGDKTSQFLRAFLLEIARLRDKYGEPVFDD